MQASTYINIQDSRTSEKSTVSITGMWVRFIKGMSQIMVEVDGKWREVFPHTSVGNADVSVEISADDISKAQPLGWLYKEGG